MSHATTHADQRAAILSAEYVGINKLLFSAESESEFQAHRRQSFLKINHSLLLICGVIYLSFIATDYAVVPSEYLPYVAGGRVCIAALMFFGYYLTKYAQNAWARHHVFYMLAALMLLVCLHISATTYFLPRPYSEIYILGIVQLYIVVPAILKPHSKLCLVTMLGMLVLTACALFLSAKPAFETDSQILRDLLANFPLSYTLFLAGLIFLSAYTAYSYEKMLRQNWLDNQLTLIKSQNLEELSEQFRMLSHKDELTQLPNRRSFQKQLDEALKNAKHSVEPFSLIMIDVDYFKAFNDIYGHQAGDDCLRKVAKSLEKTCQRKMDIPARYGGEEFMVILPHTDSQAASYLAEKIREDIKALGIAHTGSTFGMVTASLGTTTVYGTQLANVDSLIKEVDDALYVAKFQGRNCTVVAKKIKQRKSETHLKAKAQNNHRSKTSQSQNTQHQNQNEQDKQMPV